MLRGSSSVAIPDDRCFHNVQCPTLDHPVVFCILPLQKMSFLPIKKLRGSATQLSILLTFLPVRPGSCRFGFYRQQRLSCPSRLCRTSAQTRTATAAPTANRYSICTPSSRASWPKAAPEISRRPAFRQHSAFQNESDDRLQPYPVVQIGEHEGRRGPVWRCQSC